MLDINGPLLPLSSLNLSYAQTRTQESWRGAFHISQNTAQHLSRSQREDGAGRGGRGDRAGDRGRGAEGRGEAHRAGAVCCLFLDSASVHPKPQSHLISVPPLFYSNLIPDHCVLPPTLN